MLHQLVYKLNKFGFNAKMYYYGEYTDAPVVEVQLNIMKMLQ
ncbi:hypothetical protein [Clostridium tagluense]|nr:hypothetical protein [Clostridium tagluense]